MVAELLHSEARMNAVLGLWEVGTKLAGGKLRGSVSVIAIVGAFSKLQELAGGSSEQSAGEVCRSAGLEVWKSEGLRGLRGLRGLGSWCLGGGLLEGRERTLRRVWGRGSGTERNGEFACLC